MHPSITLLRKIFVQLSYHRKLQLIGLICLMLLGTIAELVSLGMVLPFLGVLTNADQIFVHSWAQPLIAILDITKADQLLLPVTVLFCLAAILSGIIRFVLLWSQIRIGHAIGSDLGALAYQQILHQPYSVHVDRNSSNVIALLINKINTIVYFIIIPTLVLITSALIILSIIIFMVMLEPVITAVVFASLGFTYLGIVYATKKKLVMDGAHIAKHQSELSQVVQEGLGGIRDIIIDGLQGVFVKLFHRSDVKLRRALANVSIIGGAPRTVIEAFGMVLIGLIAYNLVSREGGIEQIIPVIGALAMAAQRTLPLVQQGYSSWTSILGGLPSLQDLLDTLALPTSQNGGYVKPISFRKYFKLEDARFHYRESAPPVLEDITLTVRRGERIGFIGKTGGGKTTLIDIIMGLLELSAGKLLVDGIEVTADNRLSWQAHIAHVPQTIFLSDTSIAENIAFGVEPENIDQHRLRLAAESAQIASSIESWPDAYQTRVGEQGMQLSGGQRQRLGIARALYKQADILILDEATSALDTDTEQAVMDAIETINKDVTILMVAHRFTTLRHCTKIVRLVNGRVAQVGSYDSLLNNVVN